MLKKQLMDRRLKRLEKTYAGKLPKFNEVLPPILKKQIKDKQLYLADREFQEGMLQQRDDKLVDDSSERHDS